TFGRPVIASNIGDLPEVIQDGVTGLLVDPDDVDGLTAAILTLWRDVSLAARLGSAGEQSVSDAWPVAAARVCEALAATGTGTGQR
ncbi:glycosyl transferase family 1, partial [Mycobacterium sp. ITM-2017-0098]